MAMTAIIMLMPLMAMILMMQFVNLDICLQDVKMPKL